MASLGGAFAWLLAGVVDRSGRIRLRHWAEEAGGALLRVYSRPAALLAFRVCLTLAGVALCLVVAVTAPVPSVWSALWAFGVAATGELASRWTVARGAEESLRRLTWAYRSAALVGWPLLGPIARAAPARGLDRDVESDGVEEDEASDDEIEAFLEVGAEEGILEPGEGELMLRVIDFGDTIVKRVLTPRIDMVTAPEDLDLESLAALFVDSRHSRIPIYRESVEQVTGIVHLRDVLRALRESSDTPPGALAGEPFFVPDSKPVADLLSEMQARRQQMAIVVDEFGATVGLVTVEDLLEELVGEIADEHEELPSAMEPAGRGLWRLDGGADLAVLERLFRTDTGAEPYETVGGMVFGRLGSVPRVGDRVAWAGLAFEVEAMEGRRVGAVLARRADEPEAGGPRGEEE